MNKNKSLLLIKKRISNIQCGLLRFHEKDQQMAVPVKVSVNEDTSLNCIVIDEYNGYKLRNKNVNLIQKYHEDYLYITGRVSEEVQNNNRILSVEMLKVCWFVRQTKGNSSWLRQKFICEFGDEKKLEQLRA